MTLVEITRSRTRPARSASKSVDVDVLQIVRLAVWVAFCVLLLVLA